MLSNLKEMSVFLLETGFLFKKLSLAWFVLAADSKPPAEETSSNSSCKPYRTKKSKWTHI